MRTSNRVTSLIISILLIFSAFFTVSVSAATYRIYGDFKFKYLTDGTAMIAQYSGESTTMIIPDTLLDHPVSSVEPNAFYRDSFIEHVVFGKNFTTISAFAFSKSTALKDITFPDSLIDVVNGAFQDCTALTFVDFANSNVEYVSEFAFNNCAILSDVKLNDSVIKIGQQAFANNPSLQRMYIPASVTDIDESAFKNTTNVTIYCYSNSYALEYAIEHELDYFIIDAVDRSELEETIASADELLDIIDLFTPSSVENFQSDYIEAEKVYNDPFSTEEDINNANDLLLSAISSLEQRELGDVDLNDDVNIRDATAIQLYCANFRTFNEAQLILADVDGDNDVNVKDATQIQLIIAKMV